MSLGVDRWWRLGNLRIVRGDWSLTSSDEVKSQKRGQRLALSHRRERSFGRSSAKHRYALKNKSAFQSFACTLFGS